MTDSHTINMHIYTNKKCIHKNTDYLDMHAHTLLFTYNLKIYWENNKDIEHARMLQC